MQVALSLPIPPVNAPPHVINVFAQAVMLPPSGRGGAFAHMEEIIEPILHGSLFAADAALQSSEQSLSFAGSPPAEGTPHFSYTV
jgi:hypothetical protein